MKPIRNASFEIKLDEDDLLIEQNGQVVCIPLNQVQSFADCLIDAKAKADAETDETFRHQIKPR